MFLRAVSPTVESVDWEMIGIFDYIREDSGVVYKQCFAFFFRC